MAKFDIDAMEKTILAKLHPPTVRTPLVSAIEKLKGIARRKRLPTLRS